MTSAIGRSLVPLIALLAPTAPAAALDPHKLITQYSHDAWQAKDGLLQNAVRAIAQTRDGYLWLATQGGLLRFDGVKFTVFDHRNTPGLGGSIVLSLVEGRDGSLWIGTDGGGLSRFRHGRFTSYRTGDGLAQDYVWSVHEGRDGSVWIGMGGAGLDRLKDGRLTHYDVGDGYVSAVLEDRQRALWIGTTGGLARLAHGTLTYYSTKDGLAGNAIRALCEDREGSLWIGTTDGLTRRKDGHLTTYTTADGVSRLSVKSLYEDREGSLWIGTLDGGLARMVNGRFSSFTTRDGLSDDSVLSLHEDREGSLWIGTRNGLNRLRDAAVTSYTTKEGLPTDAVRTLVAARDGTIWIATDGGGLARLAGGVVTTYTRKDGLYHNHLKSIFESRDGSIWVATAENGLSRLKGRLITSYAVPAKISTISEDRRTLLLGTPPTGLSRFLDGRVVPYTAVTGPTPDITYSMHRDAAGTLWLATNGGLARSAGGAWVVYRTSDGLPHNEVYSIHENPGGTLWIATRGGLARLKANVFTAYRTRDGLFDDIVFQILEDRAQNLWMNGSRGIFRVNRRELDAFAEGRVERITSVAYDTTDGMKSAESSAFMQPAASKAPDGRLWFATDKGVVVVDPDNITVNRTPPPVLIEEMVVDHQRVPIGQDIRLSPGRQRFEFHYTGLSLLVPKKVRFKYKLDGYDRDWIDAGVQRIATYANIRPGPYTFRVKGCNNDGVWNEAGASLAFYLEPYFYQTYWFYGLSVGWAGVVILLLHRVHVKRMQAQFSAVLAERNRLAREFHDTLEAGFAGITLQLDVVAAKLVESPEIARSYLGLARNMIQHSIAEARRSVWDLRSHALEHGDLASALSAVAQQVTAGSAVRPEVRVSGTPKRLPAVDENNIFRIGQEAITNAVKHARAREVRIGLAFEPRRLTLRVHDDGCGFDSRSPQSGHGHFGLLGMRERADKLGGQLHVRTSPGHGTEVTVEVPLTS